MRKSRCVLARHSKDTWLLDVGGGLDFSALQLASMRVVQHKPLPVYMLEMEQEALHTSVI